MNELMVFVAAIICNQAKTTGGRFSLLDNLIHQNMIAFCSISQNFYFSVYINSWLSPYSSHPTDLSTFITLCIICYPISPLLCEA